MTARSISAIANHEKTPPESKRVLAGFLLNGGGGSAPSQSS
jgi:hypothetical protein